MLFLHSFAKVLAEGEDILEVIDYLSLPFFYRVHFLYFGACGASAFITYESV